MCSFLTTVCCFVPLLFSSFPLLFQIAVFTLGGLSGTFVWIFIAPLPKINAPADLNIKLVLSRWLKVTFVGAGVLVILAGLGRWHLDHLPSALYQPSPALQKEEALFAQLNSSATQRLLWIRGDTLWDALEKVGMADRVRAMEKGINTIVGKEFDNDGVVFSGGEQQKIIMARIFANEPADLIILDEPTSAMDPVSEYNIYQNIQKYLGHKTLIFISHRLTTCTMADTIYLFKAGEVIETGKHKELMDLNGEYKKMFQIQLDKYAGEQNGI